MTQEELTHLLDEHDKWHLDRSKGRKLELKNLNLKGFFIGSRDLFQAVLENIDLSESDCKAVRMAYTNLKNVNFSRANLKKADLNDCEMENVDFTGANLEEAEMMSFVIAKHLKFDDAKMNKASFIKSSMDFVSFKNALLREANFRRAHINDSSFENADCSNAEFTYATLKDCVVTGAIIEGADFSDVRHLPEEWKQAIGWHSAEQQNIRRIKEMLREEGLR